VSESADAVTGSRRRGRRARQPRRTRRVVLGVSLVVVGLVVFVGVWLAIRGISAERHLDSARAGTDTLRTALTDGDSAAAQVALEQVRDDTSAARGLTNDPVWRLAGSLPFVGDSADAVSTTADAVDDVAQDVLPALVAQVDALSPAKVRVGGNRIDVDRIAVAAPALRAAAGRADAAAAQVDGIDTDALPSRLGDAVRSAQDGLDELAGVTTDAADAAQLLPPMLGADGPRRYFVGFQTNAEARATGGLLGAYGVLEADDGRVRVVRLGPRSALDTSNGQTPAVDFGDDYRDLYGDDPGLWVNANLSPHFPYAAQLWLAMYERQSGIALELERFLEEIVGAPVVASDLRRRSSLGEVHCL